MYEWVSWQKNKERDNLDILFKILNIYIKLLLNNFEFFLV